MSLCLINKGLKAINEDSTEDYIQSVLDFQDNVKTLRLGYVPGVIRHYFHGSKKNRHYGERWKILLNHNYEPSNYIKYDKNGILIPTEICPKELTDEIFLYFQSRYEDECYSNNETNIIIKNN
jgi:hypothetical protein